MSLSLKIARALQCNYCLNRKILRIKCSWDEVSRILNAACKRKHRGCR